MSIAVDDFDTSERPDAIVYDISLVIPMFNAEEHLAECLDSVVAQTMFERVQVIVIDDGSTDGCAAIAQTYADAHTNVTLLTQPNGGPGPGSARNRGLDIAEADAIAFLDSDDVLPARSLEARLSAMASTGADLVVSRIKIFPDGKDQVSARLMDSDRVISNLSEFPELIDNGNACNKLFRRSFFERAENRFPERTHFEDAWVSIVAMLDATSIAIVSEVCYLYRKAPVSNSIMSGLFVRPQNYWEHLELNRKLLERYQDSPEQLVRLDRFIIMTIRGFVQRAHGALDEQDLRRFWDSVQRLYARFDLDDVEAYATTLGYRVALYALLADDFELYAHPDRAIAGLERHDGRLAVGLTHEPVDRFRSLLDLTPQSSKQLGTLRPTLASITSDDSSLVLAGTAQFTGGAELPIAPLGLDLELAMRGDLTFSLEVSPVAEDRRGCRWQARVPLSALVPGRQVLQIRSPEIPRKFPVTADDTTAVGLPWTLERTDEPAVVIDREPDTAKVVLAIPEPPLSFARRARRKAGRTLRRVVNR